MDVRMSVLDDGDVYIYQNTCMYTSPSSRTDLSLTTVLCTCKCLVYVHILITHPVAVDARLTNDVA